MASFAMNISREDVQSKDHKRPIAQALYRQQQKKVLISKTVVC